MSEWIPMKTRPMTEEEKEYHKAAIEYCGEEIEIFDCLLPDDGQMVLITANGNIYVDIFYSDPTEGSYFEDTDIDDVEAWMPLTEQYKES